MNRKMVAVMVMILYFFTRYLYAQENVILQRLTRGKLWICSLPNGSLERDVSTLHNWLLSYPGHYEANNEVAGGWDATRIFNVAQLNGENIGWAYRNFRTGGEVYAIQQNTKYKNYNLLDSSQPEEYMKGVMGSYKTDTNGKRHMAYELEGMTMVWSLPKYDDFILVRCRLTNTDDVPFENFYYARMVSPEGPANPLGAVYDVEYLWDDEISEEVGFIFYDDTSWPPESKGDSAIYNIQPGTLTGDRGDPGNIEIQNSRNRKLYNPFLYSFSFYPEALTPNKYGEQKVWRNIVYRASDAPETDRYPGHQALSTWSGLVGFLEREQPKVSWRAAHRIYTEGDRAGSLWERSPRYVYGIGPYDIAPGESIEWIEVFLAGQMDRDISMLGDTTATLHFVEDGLVNMKENWANAKVIINNEFMVPGDIPPPTPADAPLLGNDVELMVDPGSGEVNGIEEAGVYLYWPPVHQNYIDPLTGEADFAGYRIYRSNIDVEGPWELVNSVSVEEADAFIDDNRLRFFQPAEISIPYRYAVTSFDVYGNESAKTGYTLDGVAAQAFPTNNLDAVMVVPNPFRQESGFADRAERKRLAFLNIPEECTIRIYTLALDLVRTIEHDGGGESTWGSREGKDYLLTDFAMNISPGIYVYHIESHVNGHEGENKVGKIYIIK